MGRLHEVWSDFRVGARLDESFQLPQLIRIDGVEGDGK
jgi:hypothetical protein